MCLANWVYVHLYYKLVLCTCVLRTTFVHTCTVDWFHVHVYSYITLMEHYTSGMYRGQTGISQWRNLTHKECTGDRQEYHTDRNFTSGHFTHTHTPSQIVAYWAAPFAAKKFQILLVFTPGQGFKHLFKVKTNLFLHKLRYWGWELRAW